MRQRSDANPTLSPLSRLRRATGRNILRSSKHKRPAHQLKTADQIEQMRDAGRIVRRTLNAAGSACQPGITTGEVDAIALEVIESHNAIGLFKNYPGYVEGQGFPGNICVSVNEEIVHGIPSSRRLKDGDIVSLDCGVRLNDWCADAAVTVPVGEIDADEQLMLDTCQRVLDQAIEAMHAGRMWSEVASVMQKNSELSGFGVVRDYVGHGIGKTLHEQPQVPGFVTREFRRKHDFVLEPGMTLAVEPMLTLGSPRSETLRDGWTVVTADDVPSCHFEHTIAITPDGPQVLTDQP